MRRWHVLLIGAVAVLASGVAAAVFVDQERGCACRGAPYLDGMEATATRFVDAVRAGDVDATWELLTPEAQRRRGVKGFVSTELPTLQSRFRTAEVQRWIRGYERSQGYDTPSLVVLVWVSDALPVSALVVHSRATRDDPGRVDPDLGDAVRFTEPPANGVLRLPGTVRLANPHAAVRRFVALPLGASEAATPLALSTAELGDGRFELAGSPAGRGLLLVTVERPDGRFAVGSLPLQP